MMVVTARRPDASTGTRGRRAKLSWVSGLPLLVVWEKGGLVCEAEMAVAVPFKRSAFLYTKERRAFNFRRDMTHIMSRLTIAASIFSSDDWFALITITFPAPHDPGKLSKIQIVLFVDSDPPMVTENSAVAFPPGRKPELKPLTVVFVIEM